MFLLAQPLALRWKNLVHASPSFCQTRHEAGRHRERSIAARPKTRQLRSLRKQSSSAVSCLISCAVSNHWMISLAICSSMRALPKSLLLQALSTHTVCCILKNRIFSREIPGTCSFDASCTTSLNPRILVQNFSKRNLSCHFGLACWHSSYGQWLDSEEDRACRVNPKKFKSLSWLQNMVAEQPIQSD
jgi:hypothetical protein